VFKLQTEGKVAADQTIGCCVDLQRRS